MTTEQYSIGYDAGYQDGFDAALADPVKREPVAEYALSAARQLLDYADDSDGCQYGTLSTSLVRDAMEQILPALIAAPVDAKAIRALKLVWANSTSHDWPEDIWDAIEDALK